VLEAVRRMTALEKPPWDALVFADLSGARDSEDIVRILAREGGVTIDASSVPEIALGRALGKLGRVLLVVDPAEHVVTPLVAATQAFRRMAPELQVLATSRSRFCPPDAVAIELGPLPTSSQVSTDAGGTQPCRTPQVPPSAAHCRRRGDVPRSRIRLAFHGAGRAGGREPFARRASRATGRRARRYSAGHRALRDTRPRLGDRRLLARAAPSRAPLDAGPGAMATALLCRGICSPTRKGVRLPSAQFFAAVSRSTPPRW